MNDYRMGTKCVQAGYKPGNGEPRQIPIIQATSVFNLSGFFGMWARYLFTCFV